MYHQSWIHTSFAQEHLLDCSEFVQQLNLKLSGTLKFNRIVRILNLSSQWKTDWFLEEEEEDFLPVVLLWFPLESHGYTKEIQEGKNRVRCEVWRVCYISM